MSNLIGRASEFAIQKICKRLSNSCVPNGIREYPCHAFFRAFIHFSAVAFNKHMRLILIASIQQWSHYKFNSFTLNNLLHIPEQSLKHDELTIVGSEKEQDFAPVSIL